MRVRRPLAYAAVVTALVLTTGARASQAQAEDQQAAESPVQPALVLATADLSATAEVLEGRADYGGMWVSPDNRLVIASTGASLTSSMLAGVVPARARTEVRAVKRSWKDLLALQESITQRVGSLDKAGIRVNEVGVLVRDNRVEVVIEPGSPAGSEARLSAEFGDGISVARRTADASPASDRTSPYPTLRAGLRIVGGGTSCTAGINFINSLGQYYALTAGHCGNRTWRQGTSSGPLLGATHANHFGEGTVCDCAAVGPLTAAKASNIVYTGPSTGQALYQTRYLSVHQLVCYSGASTAANPVKCGTVEAFPVNIRYTNYGNRLVKDLVRVAGPKIQPGDSGSPVYVGSNAVGVGVAFSNTSEKWYYSHVQKAFQLMNARLLTS
jgi:hypothetical protein